VSGVVQLKAIGSDYYYNLVPNLPASWTTSNSAVANVSPSGLVTAVAPGEAVITAQALGATASSFVMVPVPSGPEGPGIPPFTMATVTSQSTAISVITSDGTSLANIVCPAQCGFAWTPQWSRDGSKLAITALRGLQTVLFVANRDGTNLHEVASADAYTSDVPAPHGGFYGVFPALENSWSADGRLVYVRETANGNAIETVNADGSGRTTIMPANHTRPMSPAFGLDDSMITLVIGDHLYAVNPDGSDLRLLAGSIASFKPTWSPDGKLIAFEGIPQTQELVATQRNFVVLDPVSGAVRQFLVPPISAFCWSPTGSRILLVGNSSSGLAAFGVRVQSWRSIYTVNADGSDLHQAVVTLSEFSDIVNAAWSPDSRFLIYMDDRVATTGLSGTQIYAQAVAEGTNTRVGGIQDVRFFDIAEVRGCSRPYTVGAP
jgi:Tol biopolymer transport system component